MLHKGRVLLLIAPHLKWRFCGWETGMGYEKNLGSVEVGLSTWRHNSQFNGSHLKDAFIKHTTCHLGQRIQKEQKSKYLQREHFFLLDYVYRVQLKAFIMIMLGKRASTCTLSYVLSIWLYDCSDLWDKVWSMVFPNPSCNESNLAPASAL